MRPEVSALVRALNYPELLDAESVRGRPNVLGLQSNVVFFDHRLPESAGEVVADAHQSHVNPHEARLTAYVVRHLLYQGYRPDQIVVLTPYVAQLLEMRRALAEIVSSVFFDPKGERQNV